MPGEAGGPTRVGCPWPPAPGADTRQPAAAGPRAHPFRLATDPGQKARGLRSGFPGVNQPMTGVCTPAGGLAPGVSIDRDPFLYDPETYRQWRARHRAQSRDAFQRILDEARTWEPQTA